MHPERSQRGRAAPRHLEQPGPRLEPRLDSLPARVTPLEFTLEPGLTLLEAVARPLRAAGFASAALELRGGGFGPFAYVLPAHAPDATHVAWYSATHQPPGGARLERACITFGQREGVPWLHCHAIWQEASGRRRALPGAVDRPPGYEAAGRRAGHVLPEETVVAAPVAVRAWGLSGAGFAVRADAETNFSIFQPAAMPGPAGGSRAVVLRVRPNEDVVAALEAACRAHGLARAVLRGGVGSLVSPRFAEGTGTGDIATELLVTAGGVGPEGAHLAVALADMRGEVHAGTVPRGGNAVCITCELVLEEVPG
ncbi:DNA-binding protein [Roseicella aquatilis]|uniref:DNA-binding protein n=2 Tax=Roseicella aquatilis TaxID=2527868 RepID=A0A4R4DJT0_9PROT|nr:DNA-binding protein [Roseicella aquatilis]